MKFVVLFFGIFSKTVKVTSDVRTVRCLKDLVLSLNYPCIENMLSFSFGLVYSIFCKKDCYCLKFRNIHVTNTMVKCWLVANRSFLIS